MRDSARSTDLDLPLQLTAGAVALGLPVAEWLPGNSAAAWQLLVTGLILGVVLLGRGGRPPAPEAWLLAGFLTLVATIYTAWDAVDSTAHWIVAIQILIFVALGPFAVAGLTRVPRLPQTALAAFMVGQSVSATAAVLQAVGITVLGLTPIYGRSSGLAGHPNILGLFSGITVLLAFHLLRRPGARKRLPLLVLVVSAGGLLASGSLSAITALLGGLVVYFLAARLRLRVLAAVVAGIYLAYRLSLVLAERVETFRGPVDRLEQIRESGSTTTNTVDIRQRTWRYAWEHIQADWTAGRGLDDKSGSTYDGFTLTHDVLLRAWFQGGPVLGATFLLLFGLAVVLVVRAIRQWRAAAGGVLTLVWFFALTAATFQQGYLWVPLLCAAVACGQSAVSASSRPPSPVLASAGDQGPGRQ